LSPPALAFGVPVAFDVGAADEVDGALLVGLDELVGGDVLGGVEAVAVALHEAQGEGGGADDIEEAAVAGGVVGEDDVGAAGVLGGVEDPAVGVEARRWPGRGQT